MRGSYQHKTEILQEILTSSPRAINSVELQPTKLVSFHVTSVEQSRETVPIKNLEQYNQLRRGVHSNEVSVRVLKRISLSFLTKFCYAVLRFLDNRSR